MTVVATDVAVGTAGTAGLAVYALVAAVICEAEPAARWIPARAALAFGSGRTSSDFGAQLWWTQAIPSLW